MKIRNPYKNLPRWFRGNAHTHSALSDGDWPPERVIAYYQERGYHFLAMTDHEVFTDLSRFTTRDFLALSSGEVTVRGREHIVGLNLKRPVDPVTHHQAVIDAISDQGGLAILAHPNWSHFSVERCLGLHGYVAIEIANTVCHFLEYNGYALQHWDELLKQGVKIWGIAADDAHRISYQGAKAWIVVNAERLTAADIVENIRTGNFYASTGPEFHGFHVSGNTIEVRCSPAIEIRFLTGDLNPALRVRGEGVTQAEYTPRAGDPYVRVEITDEELESAWSQPFFIDPDWRP
jgi:predicted metal-dependent phosphoesterase TrpH